MQNNRRRRSAFSVWLKNEKGFHFITLLTMLAIISITLPFFGYALTTINSSTDMEELRVNEFFRFIRDEIIQSQDYAIQDNNALILFQENDEVVSIQQYASLIRRRVGFTGHEIYFRDAESIRFYDVPAGIKLVLTTKEGGVYERIFTFYNGT